MQCLHDTGVFNKLDDDLWDDISALRMLIAKDTLEAPSLFTLLKKAFAQGDYETASKMQLELAMQMDKLRKQYTNYKANIID